MPRLPTSLLRRAYALDPNLPALLGPCRDLRTAQNELRWLREHVEDVANARRAKGDVMAKGALLRELVQQRAKGKPLQYILGSEWFGDLEIRCRKGVLIPRYGANGGRVKGAVTKTWNRQDTAASISHLVRFLRNAPGLPTELRVLDLCTGTGCIPLLFAHDFHNAPSETDLRILGVDISHDALKLAGHNLKRTCKFSTKRPARPADIRFLEADILLNPFADQSEGPPSLKAALNFKRLPPFWDIVISNPPYISPKEYWKTTTRSVRGFEPKLALVPLKDTGGTDVEQGDAFYQPLLDIAADVEAKIVLLEIADMEQALRVARQAQAKGIFDGIEIWRDQPDNTEQLPDMPISPDPPEFPVIGQGNARTVLCYRGRGTKWLQKATMIPPHTDEADDPDSSTSSPSRHGGLEPSFDKGLLKFGDGHS
jgi:methylase of polypeptide subunit release factors